MGALTPVVSGIKKFFGAARAYTESVLGGPCNEIDSNVTFQTSVGIVLQGNADRVGLVIVNNGANDVWIGLTSATAVNQGIRIAASGGNVTMNVRDDFTFITRTLYGIANGGTSSVYFAETLRQQYTPQSEVA